MEKFFKSITSNSYMTALVMFLVIAFIWDQYHEKNFFGLFPAKPSTTV